MKKMIIDTQSKVNLIRDITEAEHSQILLDNQLSKEQKLLESLIPSEEEIRKAETELLVVEILTDGGLI